MAISPLALRRFACAVMTLVVLSAMLLSSAALAAVLTPGLRK